VAKQLLVIGAGSGGLILSNTVARQLSHEIRRGEVSVTLLGDRDQYLYQPGLLYVIFDQMRVSELFRKVRDLLVPGVTFIHDRAVKIDPKSQSVQTAGGKALAYDYLVVATGSEINPAEVPGLAEGAHWFYTMDGALKMREALHNFQGGKMVLAMGVPHKCPVAPLEFVFMFDEWARAKGIREKTEIVYSFPLNRIHNLHSVSEWAAVEFEKRGIQFEGFFNLDTVDPEKREVNSIEGTTLSYDLLVAIPPHMGAQLGPDSGLTKDVQNWLPTHRNTLQLGSYENIFVVGDAAGLPVPKAGSVAHFEAEVLRENLVSLLTGGRPAHTYHGKSFCFIESGMDKATYLSFDYEHPPKVTPPTQALHWFKHTYNRIHWMNLKGIV